MWLPRMGKEIRIEPNRFLIETLPPRREISEQARREKAIRYGHRQRLERGT